MRRVLVAAAACIASAAAAQVTVGELLGGGNDAGYERALEPRAFEFPGDHGAHPGFRSEWWYFSGNLRTTTGRHFGFQLTFFRFALSPAPATRTSAWATNQAWMAHFAVTDTEGRRFHAVERLGRGALGIAGAQAAPFRVWLGEWEAAGPLDGGGLYPLRLAAGDKNLRLELRLTSDRGPVLQGEDGLDPKGPEAGNASYYYAYPRLEAQGQLRLGEDQFVVSGAAWMDREWGTSALGPELEGWDWLALQLSDGRALMLYRLRRKDGRVDAYSKGALIMGDGERIALGAQDFELAPRRWWTSERTGVRYPVAWSLSVPGRGLELQIEPRLEDQELDLSVRYWEGAVSASGRANGNPVAGEGYLELAGY